VQSKDPEQMANANAAMTGALGRLLAVSEAYPQLKSDQGFLKLQDELAGTENRVAVSRTDYNGAVQQYNSYIRQFPAVLTAKMTGAKERKYFQVTNAANREAPSVDFGKPGAAGAGTPGANPAGTSAPTMAPPSAAPGGAAPATRP
jgi:LemA protein